MDCYKCYRGPVNINGENGCTFYSDSFPWTVPSQSTIHLHGTQSGYRLSREDGTKYQTEKPFLSSVYPYQYVEMLDIRRKPLFRFSRQ